MTEPSETAYYLELADLLERGPVWRLSNLYFVKDKVTGKPVPFRPKPEQQTIIHAVYVLGRKKILVPKARQLGISTVISLIILDTVLFTGGAKAAIVDLTQADATTKLKDKVVFAFDRLPESLSTLYEADPNNDSAFGVKLKGSDDTKSEVQAGMRARGDTFQVLLISEWGKIQFSDQIRSDEILTGALPAAEEGLTFVETTWKGGKGGNLWDIMDRAMKTRPEHMTSKDFHLFFFPWWGEPAYALEGDVSQIPKEVNKYLDETARAIWNHDPIGFRDFTPGQRLWYYKVAWAKGLFRFEEYPSLLEECFRAPIEGSIYGDLIDRLQVKGAIRPAEVDRTALVHTAWDLGSPINRVVWFFQIVAAEIRVIDLAMDNDWNTTDLVANLMAKGYPYGWHYLPHDAAATQKSGYSFEYELQKTGLQNTRIVPQTLDIWIGINHLRELLPRFTFRLPACERGVEALSCYHTKRETSGGTAVDLPVHDWASHPADGLRTLAEAELYGMIHNSGPAQRPRLTTGFRGDVEHKQPVGILEEWFSDRPKRPKVIR